MMTYQKAITYIMKNAHSSNAFKKAVATQIVGIRTAKEIERKAS